jgi:hypothetical protein
VDIKLHQEFTSSNYITTGSTGLLRAVSTKRGQAMVEFLVGIVAILAVTTSMIVAVHLVARHTDTMIQARKRAGDTAASPLYDRAANNPQYLRSWLPGDDGKRHTSDDRPVHGDESRFESAIVEESAQNGDGWQRLDSIPDNTVSKMHNSVLPSSYFGLVKGESDSVKVDLSEWPAFMHLVYSADSIEVQSETWLTWMKGIY